MKHSPGFLAIVERSKARVPEVTIAQVQARLAAGAGIRLVDVREDCEWEAGRIAGAEHLGKGVIERDIEGAIPDKDAEIVLYCGGGYRSLLAGDALQQMGYTNVASMAGGWRGWLEVGGRTEGAGGG
ncbi:MAG: sulfurtransferase [Gemmatimonadetes bacterium]|nr:sulfurtransferase [Gemmatimonadota bacterium]